MASDSIETLRGMSRELLSMGIPGTGGGGLLRPVAAPREGQKRQQYKARGDKRANNVVDELFHGTPGVQRTPRQRQGNKRLTALPRSGILETLHSNCGIHLIQRTNPIFDRPEQLDEEERSCQSRVWE